LGVDDDEDGITTFWTVSPATRFDVNAPWSELPVVDSEPADAPLIVRWVLPLASPVTVCALVSSTTLMLLSRRVAVPFTVVAVETTFVVLSGFSCAWPAPFL
jgi:hypothetical protein